MLLENEIIGEAFRRVSGENLDNKFSALTFPTWERLQDMFLVDRDYGGPVKSAMEIRRQKMVNPALK